jgi:hypothetical protein
MTTDRDTEIRRLRRNGELLGPLTDRFGAEAVVRALGAAHIAASHVAMSLLPPDDEPRTAEDDYHDHRP